MQEKDLFNRGDRVSRKRKQIEIKTKTREGSLIKFQRHDIQKINAKKGKEKKHQVILQTHTGGLKLYNIRYMPVYMYMCTLQFEWGEGESE